jgi:hypothetical protein
MSAREHAEHVQSHEVVSRLFTLGASEEPIRESVGIGVRAYRHCTRFHPPSAPGYYQWSEIVVALRQALVPSGWTPNDDGGLSTVVNPEGTIAIAVAGGSDRTGLAGYPSPTTRHPRGAMSHAAVRINQQLSFNPETLAIVVPQGPGETPGPATWWLLVCTHHDIVRFELSRPNAISDGGKIDSWAERILFEPLTTEAAAVAEPAEVEAQPIDVRVERR